ncbi:MAG: haloacid dehalogenase-like hydrolase [Clostridia bacterium]|nr:haloacid dehalogenase-like hydrolase [Clostridia bacterium]
MELNNKPINIFDFDGTLTTETWPKFWVWVKKFGYSGEERNDNLENALAEYRKINTGNALETFFGFFNDLLVSNNEAITYEELMAGERYIKYNPGVIKFLQRTSAKNYIVSGGLKEFLQNLKTARYFEGIYGTPVQHNQRGLVTGIGEVMTDDKKILAIQDILKKNNRKDNDCSNVYYVGDGYSDEAAMRFVHSNGGKAVFVHQPNKNDESYHYNNKIYETLNVDGIVDFCCVADYSDGTELSNILERQKEKGENLEEESIR